MVSEDVLARVTSYIKHQGAKSPDAIVSLVADSQSRLLTTLSAHDDAAAARKPAPDEWSLHELLRHVVSAEHGVGTIVERLSRSQQIDGERRTGSMTEDGGSYEQLLLRLRDTNERLLRIIAELPANMDRSSTSAHPFFGELNCTEWAAFQKVHDEDHIQHAGKIIASWT